MAIERALTTKQLGKEEKRAAGSRAKVGKANATPIVVRP
jgi:hypothetical protein